MSSPSSAYVAWNTTTASQGGSIPFHVLAKAGLDERITWANASDFPCKWQENGAFETALTRNVSRTTESMNRWDTNLSEEVVANPRLEHAHVMIY